MVLKVHPTILISGGVPDPEQPGITRYWKDLMGDLLPSKQSEVTKWKERGTKSLTEEEKLVRKKLFLMLTGEESQREKMTGKNNTFY
jgi:hypothetical protein